MINSTAFRYPFPAWSQKHAWIIGFLLAFFSLTSCQKSTPPFEDVSHFSAVFKRDKFYRLYLPAGYDRTNDRYPVIYFFHGWGGRYKSDDNARLAYDSIRTLADKYNVILVMWDGNVDEQEPRPYNIGNPNHVSSEIQMKDYFLELVEHVDSTYRTNPEKDQRGLIGFSMGGFMAYFLAGAYPDRVCAAVNMTGSPEFFVGYPNNHTLYPVRYTFKNLRNVKLRFHNSTADELTALNAEVDEGAKWEGGLSYDYWQFTGGHVVDLPGKTEVFEKAISFVSDAFKNPLPPPGQWSHYDLYTDFKLYDYTVKSTKQGPGFIYLDDVSKSGFGLSTLRWLPDGPAIDTCLITITTAPLYTPNTSYEMVTYAAPENTLQHSSVVSDSEGRVTVSVDQKGYEVGLYQPGDAPHLITVAYKLEKENRYLRTGKENPLQLILVNRGGDIERPIHVKIDLVPHDSTITLKQSSRTMTLKPHQRIFTTPPFQISASKKPPLNGAPPWVKFTINMATDSIHLTDELMVPVYFDVLPFDNIFIDDGKSPSDSIQVYGKGNGNGVAEAGESVMIYADGHRLRLYTDDPFIVRDNEILIDEVLPAKWPDGITLSSVIHVDKNCPGDHIVECLADFETKGFMPIERRLTWGKVKFQVSANRTNK